MNKHFSLNLIGNLKMAFVSQKFSNDNDLHEKLYFFSTKMFNPVNADFSERWEVFTIENQQRSCSLEIFNNNPKYEIFSKISVKRLFSKTIFRKHDRKLLFELQYNPNIIIGFMVERLINQDFSVEFTLFGLSVCFFNIEENEIF